MSKEIEIAQQLKKLAREDDCRSEAAKLREIYGSIETAISAGVSYATIHQVLMNNGFHITLGTFRTNVARLRKRMSASKPPKAPARKPIEDDLSPARNAELITPQDISKIAKDIPDLNTYMRIAKRSSQS